MHGLPEGAEKSAGGEASLGEREPPYQAYNVIPTQGRMPKICEKHSPSLGISWLGAPMFHRLWAHAPPKHQRTFLSSLHHTSVNSNPLPIPLPKTNAPIRSNAPSCQVHLRYILVRVAPPSPDRFRTLDL
jgi:hypothetical protein